MNNKSNLSEGYLSKTFAKGELEREATVSKMEIVQTEVEQNSGYELYHIEKLQNAFDDIDRLTAEKLNNPA